MGAAPSALLAYVLKLRSSSHTSTAPSQIVFPSLNISHVVSTSAGILTILVGIRMSWAISRYNEACGLLYQLQGEWFSAVRSVFAFSTVAPASVANDVVEFRQELARL